MEHESDGDTSSNGYSHPRIGKKTRGLGNTKMRENHANYSIIKIDQNTEMSPGDLRRLAVSQTLVEDHQLMQARKILKII